MTPFDLMAELHRRKVLMSVEGCDLKWSGPSENGMNVALIRELKRHKLRIIEILTGSDPRPDLATDSSLWIDVLRLASTDAHSIDSIYGVLIGLRSCGAALAYQKGRYRLASGEMSAEEYDQFRAQYLFPRQRQISALLASLNHPEGAAA